MVPGETMSTEHGHLGHTCPACGRGLGPSPELRRCPHCGARALWRRREPALDLPLVLFNARLCGIMAGIQVALIALLVGSRGPAPPPAVLWASLVLAAVGYVIAGAVAVRIAPTARRGFLVLMAALNLGLLTALIAAELGLSEPVSLLGVTAFGTAASWPLVARALTVWVEEER